MANSCIPDLSWFYTHVPLLPSTQKQLASMPQPQDTQPPAALEQQTSLKRAEASGETEEQSEAQRAKVEKKRTFKGVARLVLAAKRFSSECSWHEQNCCWWRRARGPAIPRPAICGPLFSASRALRPHSRTLAVRPQLDRTGGALAVAGGRPSLAGVAGARLLEKQTKLPSAAAAASASAEDLPNPSRSIMQTRSTRRTLTARSRPPRAVAARCVSGQWVRQRTGMYLLPCLQFMGLLSIHISDWAR